MRVFIHVQIALIFSMIYSESIPNGSTHVRNGMLANIRTSRESEYSLADNLPFVAGHECGGSIASKFDLYC